MNKVISLNESNKTIKFFIDSLPLTSRFKFSDKVQFGQIFEKLAELSVNDHVYDYSKHFRFFIQDFLGYNSFKYYQNQMTDYVLEEEGYGTSYGIYNPKNIKFIDGPL
jgi:hypothetical protein